MTMHSNPNHKKLVTVITEAALEGALTRDIERLGASGHTITDARGRGSRGVRSAGWDSNSNIRLEIVCSDDVAEAICKHLEQTYYANYSMILFTTDVGVLRGGKF